MARYLKAGATGKPTGEAGLSVSTGASDANKIIETGSDGLIDISLMPVGIGAATVVAPASENLTAGNVVNLWLDTATLKVRKADASQGVTYSADGFVKANVTSGANATIYLSGTNSDLTGLTIGSEYFTSATPGAVTSTVPTTTNHIVQSVGKAISATELAFFKGDVIIN